MYNRYNDITKFITDSRRLNGYEMKRRKSERLSPLLLLE